MDFLPVPNDHQTLQISWDGRAHDYKLCRDPDCHACASSFERFEHVDSYAKLKEQWSQLVAHTWPAIGAIPGGRSSYVRLTAPQLQEGDILCVDGRATHQLIPAVHVEADILEEIVEAEVRIFYNAGWKLDFTVSGHAPGPPMDPIVSLKFGDCEADAEQLSFFIIRPVAIEWHNDSNLRMQFATSVNHLREADHYTDWRRAQSFYRKDYRQKVRRSGASFLKEWHPQGWFSQSGSDQMSSDELTLDLCYYDAISMPSGTHVGIVKFVLAPSDGFEFVVFSLIGLIGIPVLLMAGFRRFAQKHAKLRRDAVGQLAALSVASKHYAQFMQLPVELEGLSSSSSSSDSDDMDRLDRLRRRL